MNSKWELVLIDWVNCLKMGRPIDNLESLQNGEFLINFMNALIKTQLTPAKIVSEIATLIKNEYPSFNFNLSLSSNRIADLTSRDFMPLLSILMHHSCIVNQRDIVTSPMCFHISKEYQIYIKRFLEEMNLSTGDINLNDVISKCLSTDESYTFNQWIASAGDSPLCSRTPLKEYLQTPFKTPFLREKEHEIKKLRTCLELESFEKADLLDELKEHKEKVEQLKQQLKRKCQDVSKLRNELFDAERKSSPQSVKKKCDLNRQLGAEIADLEKYIRQLQREQEELQIEKDSSTKKLKKAESELRTASEKIDSLEVVCDQFTDKHREQQQELETLRSNCSELNILLSELRIETNPNNSSLFDISQDNVTSSCKRKSHNLNDTASCEDLACSVIEVQLRDAQEELCTLKEELNKSVDLNKDITVEMDKLKVDFDELTKKFEVSEEDKLNLKMSFEQLQVCLGELQVARQEVFDNFNYVVEEKDQLSYEVQRLAKTNIDISVKLQQSICDVFALEHKLAESESTEAFVKSVNDMMWKQNDSLRDESAHLQRLLNQKISELTESNCKINSLEKAFDNLDLKFEMNLKNLEQTLLGTIQKDYSDKNGVFEDLLEEMQTKDRMEFEAKEDLRLKLREFEMDVDTLEQKVDDLKLKELADFEFSTKLQENLKEAAVKHEILEKSIGEKNDVIEKLKLDLVEMDSTVDALNCLKINFVQQENEIKLRKTITDSSLLNFIRDMENVNKIFETRTLKPVRETDGPNREMRNILEHDDNLKQIEKSWTESENEFLIETSKVNKNIVLLLTELENKNLELESCKEQYKFKSEKLDKIEIDYKEMKKEFEANKHDLFVKIDVLDGAKSKLQEELNKQNVNNILKAEKFEEVSKNFQKLAEEKESSGIKSESLKNDIKSLAEKLIISEKLCEDKDDVLAKTSQELLTNKLELESKKQAISVLKEELGDLYLEMNDIKTEMVRLKEEYESDKIKVELLEKEIILLQAIKEDLTKKNYDLENNYLYIIEQLKLKNEECNACIEDIKKSRQKKEEEIISLKTNLVECNAQILELNGRFDNTCSKHDLKIKCLNQEKAKLTQLIFSLEVKEQDYIKDIKLIRSNMAKLISTCINLAKENKESDEELTALNSKNDNLTIEDLIAIFDKLNIVLLYLQEQKDSLETSGEKDKLALKEYKEKEEENLDRVKILTDSKSLIETDLETKENLLKNLQENFESLKQNFTKDQEDNKAILDSKEKDIFNLLMELEDSKQVSVKCQKEKEVALNLKENELTILQVNFINLEESFALHQKDSETINECKTDLVNKLAATEEETQKKIILCEKQFDLLKERYDQLENNSYILKNKYLDFEETKTEKKRLEQILNNREAIIEELSSTISSLQNNFELADNKIKDLQVHLSERVFEITKASTEISVLNRKLLEVENSLGNVIRERDSLLELKRTIQEDAEIKIKSAHENAMQLQKDLEERSLSAQKEVLNSKQIQNEIEIALIEEKSARGALEVRILDLENEKVNLLQIKFKYKSFISKITEEFPENINTKINEGSVDEFVILEELSNQIELQIVDVIKSKNDLARSVRDLKEKQKTTQNKICTLEEMQINLSKEKEQLQQKFDQIHLEKSYQHQQNFEALSLEYDLLKAKYEQYKNYCQDNEKKHMIMEDKVQKLCERNKSISDNYSKFRHKYQTYKATLESILKDRNLVDTILNSLNEKLYLLQFKSNFINEESYKCHFEKKKTLELINLDLQKQFLRCSKVTYNICFNLNNIFDATTNKIIEDKVVDFNEQIFDHGCLNDTRLKLEEIKELAEDAIQRVNTFVIPAEKASNILKESNSISPNKDFEDLRKKFNTMKQKLILVENAKNNYERKIQILREENGRLHQNKRPIENMDSEAHYKTLLQQHMQTKEEHETLIIECDAKYKQLLRDFDHYKREHPKEDQSNQTINKILQDRSIKLEKEIHKLRDAYGNLMSDKSKLELENITIRKVLDDRNVKIGDLTVIKEAYEKLLEDNNKLITDIDTLKYKRTRDREEFVRILKNEKDEYENREGKRIQDIRNEYELKLEKMKDKMVKLYKEEVDKEMQKVFSEKSNNTTLMETIEHLRDELTDTQLKLHLLECERSSVLEQLHHAQRQITQHRPLQQQKLTSSIPTYHLNSAENLLGSLSGHFLQNKDRQSILRSDSTLNIAGGDLSSILEDRRCSTMPRNCGGLNVLEEIRIHKRMSISANSGNARGLAPASSDLEMEDEDDMFNNKCLADLKEGRCNFSLSNKQPNNSRMSELVYRNSLCLPHLKSSYPCETQFTSPSVIKEDGIKRGANTSPPTSKHSTHLPPPHPHQRTRKDAGTTSYKRPGPPTPSKNGGRASLNSMDRAQGAIVPLREINDGRASIATSVVQQARNRLTPTRLKALFSGKGRGAGGGSTSTVENQGSPKGKRLSIFKKPR